MQELSAVSTKYKICSINLYTKVSMSLEVSPTFSNRMELKGHRLLLTKQEKVTRQPHSLEENRNSFHFPGGQLCFKG